MPIRKRLTYKDFRRFIEILGLKPRLSKTALLDFVVLSLVYLNTRWGNQPRKNPST